MTRVLLVSAILSAGVSIHAVAQPGATTSAPPATSAATAPAQQRIATVDALLLVDLVLDAEPIKTARGNKGKELDQTFRVPQKELMDLEAKLMVGDKADPKREGMIREWETKKKALSELQTSLSTEFDKFNSAKAAEAWNIVTSKIDQLAVQYGYTHVITTRRERSFIAETQAGTVQQLLSRPVIIAPAADDLTDRAIELMNLKEIYNLKKAEEAKAAAAAAANTTPVPLAAPAAPNATPPAQTEKKPEGTSLPKTAPGFPASTEKPK